MPIQAQILEAVEAAKAAGLSENQIALAAGIPQPSLQRWLSGRRQSMSGDNLDRLTEFFGMRLTKPKIPKPQKKARKANGSPRVSNGAKP